MGMMIIRHKVRVTTAFGAQSSMTMPKCRRQRGSRNPRVHHSADSNKPSAWRPCFARAESIAEFVAGVAG